MAGRKQLTNEDFEVNKKMIEIGREEGARDAQKALETVNAVHDFGLSIGRAQAFKSMRMLSEYLEIKNVLAAIDRKEYLKIQGVSNLDDYLKKSGLSRSKFYEDKKISNLSAEEVQMLGLVGFTRKDLLGYASLPDEKRMEICDGKVINIEKANREEIREIIEKVLQDNRQVKDDAEKSVKAIERLKDVKQETIDKNERLIADLKEKLDAKAIPSEEADYIKLIEKLDVMLYGYLADIRQLVEGNVPGPTAALRLVSLLNRLRMEANHWYQDAYDVHAPADAAPEEEWVQPEN